MLDQLGPVFTQNLGGNLSHFDIQMAGPLGRLHIYNTACYEFWISRGRGTEQDQTTIGHFKQFLLKAYAAVGESISEATLKALDHADARPTLMMFDYCAAGVRGEDKTAISQFGLHLASAYLSYCESANEPTKA